MAKKILVVDDDTDFREGCVELLNVFGYRAISASNGQEGYDIAIKEMPDLIFCDRNMPVMNGYEMACRLREDEKTRQIKLCATGSFSDEEKSIFDKGVSKGNLSLVSIVGEMIGEA